MIKHTKSLKINDFKAFILNTGKCSLRFWNILKMLY